MRSLKSWLGVPAVVVGLVAIAACGSSSSSSSSTGSSTGTGTTSTPTVNAAVAKLVPASIKSKGTITVAADATYAPNEFIGSDGHTVVGMDPDLVQALAAVMGLKANVVNATFDTIIPGLQAGKYDMGASSFTDTKARQKVVTSSTTSRPGRRSSPRPRVEPRSRASPTCAARSVVGRERHDRGNGCQGSERQVHEGRQAEGERARLPDTELPRTWRCPAVVRRSGWPTRRSPRTR